MKTLDGKLALITGGSSGIGLALAKKLSSSGCQVGILSRNESKLKAAAEEIRQAASGKGIQVSTIQADVSNYEQTLYAINAWQQDHGIPDLFINSAGVSKPGLFEDLDVSLFRWMMDINYFGSIHTTKAILPGMIERGAGHIVYISSVAGFLGMYGYTAYAPTKFAIKGFVDTLRTEVSTRGITLSIVFPPDTETPSLQYERPYQPPVLVAMNENSPAVSAESVANAVIKGILRNQYIITPSSDATLYFKLVGLLGGGLIYRVLDIFLADARRKVAANKAKYTRNQITDPD
jgi:3-dehydrosphinganine reductase